VHGETELWRVLVALSPRLIVHLMSLLTLGMFRVGQQVRLDEPARSTGPIDYRRAG